MVSRVWYVINTHDEFLLKLINVLLGQYLDILAISCDSFNEDTNFNIGRRHGNKNHLTSLKSVQSWCSQYKVAFKINTVVNTHNCEENMAKEILELKPIRWKVCIIDQQIQVMEVTRKGTLVLTKLYCTNCNRNYCCA